VRLEIAVNENFVKPTVDAITRAGQLSAEEASGFGKIFLTELLDVVRIRTGERGPDAI
jgi:nitrogen regulatory protein P-II 1